MPWSGGSYTKGNAGTGGWTGDASLGIGIEAGRHDNQDNDFATGINNCLTKDGTNSATANINYGGFIPSNVGAGTAAAPAYCAGGDVNTGMFSPAADTIAWATNGVERLKLDATGGLALRRADAAGCNLFIQNYALTNNGSNLQLEKSRGGALDTNAIVQNGDTVGSINWNAANGSSYNTLAAIRGVVDGVPGASNDMPGRLEFYTTPDGSGTLTERMRITNAGNVGIGLTNPTAPLEISAETGAAMALRLRARSAGTETASLEFSNKTGLAQYALLNGSASGLAFSSSAYFIYGLQSGAGTHFMKWNNSTGDWTYDTSSERYKKNITNSSYGLNTVKLLQPKAFTYKDTDRNDIGFIAEEMQHAIPEVVALDKDGRPDAISYDRLTAVLCKAIQELAAKVEALEALQAA